MGADGGVIYIPVNVPAQCGRIRELLKPFGQFLSEGGGSFWGERANVDWEESHPEIRSPRYILGYYGTDRGDYVDLSHLRGICTTDDEIYDLTFSDIDLDYRTAPDPRWSMGPLYKLWHEHFWLRAHEEVVSEIGPLATIRVADWAKELRQLLDFDNLTREETWT